jgi:DNA-binding MarR family transcriptional regulator
MAQDQDPRYEITWLVRRLFRDLAAVADGYLADCGLTAADRAVLEFLYPDHRLTVPEIAALYRVSRQHVQTTVNGLLSAGHIAAHSNPRHKRSPKYGLTEAGRDTFAGIRKNEAGLVATLFEGIVAEDLSTTRDTLARLRERLESGELS